MRVLVCGSREWTDTWSIWTFLDGITWPDEVTGDKTVLIHGAARGADTLAAEWAMVRLEPDQCESFPADWEKHGKRAGYIRNRQMLEEGKPDVVLAFRCEGESPGTDMMVKLARDAGVPVYVITGGKS